MKATFALLADRAVHNVVRKLAWELQLKYRTGTRHCSLPPHVSLKQPFRCPDLPGLEAYMDELAASIAPFELPLTELQVRGAGAGGNESGILWVAVAETPYLRGLHERLNRELAARFGDTAAEFDGPDYQFHLTVNLGGQSLAVYQAFLEEVGDPRVDLRFTTREMAMFVYDEAMGPAGDYLCYKIMPLGTS